MNSAPAGEQPRLHHLTAIDTPIGPSPACGRIILSEFGPGDCAVPPARGVSIKYVLAGEERYESPGGSACVRAGEFAIVGPGIPLTAILERSETTIGLCVYLPEREPRLIPAEGEREFGVFGGGNTGLAPLLEQVTSRLSRRPQLRPPAVGALLNRMRLELNGLAHSDGPPPDILQGSKEATREELARRLKLARDYLHGHAGKSVTLVELGRACGISPFHLARTFRQAYGVGPGAYHLELRLAQAGRLLREGELCVKVAERLGYSEPSSFLRAFKQRYGVTPGHYIRSRQVKERALK